VTTRDQSLKDKIQELKLRQLRARQGQLRGTGEVPCKKKSKPVGYKLQNTFEKNLKGVPGGSMSRGVTASIVKMIAAPGTGTKVRKDSIGALRSARNANTTQGSYIRTVVTNGNGRVESDSQGRKVFGR